MQVLTLAPHYLPGFRAGGTIRSVANVIDCLGDEFDFRIVTADHDLGETQRYGCATGLPWQAVGKAQVSYLPINSITTARLVQRIRQIQPNLIYLNGLFNPRFTLTTLLLRRSGVIKRTPILLAPHGELGEEPLSSKSWKKRPVLAVAKRLGLFKGVTWQATCEHEATSILSAIGPDADVRIAPNLPNTLGAPPCRPAKQSNQLRIVYLSRIAPIKNLEWGLRMLRDAPPNTSLDVFGPIEDQDYWRRCQEEIGRLQGLVEVRHHGAVHPNQTHGILSQYDAMLFPTLHENYGYAAIEAFAAGCPLLISDRTPWRDLEQQGVGWDLPLEEPAAFQAAVQRLSAMGELEHAAMRSSAVAYAAQQTKGAVHTMAKTMRAAAA